MMKPTHNPSYTGIARTNDIKHIIRPIVRACDQADHEATERLWIDETTVEYVCLNCHEAMQSSIRNYNNEN